jgi:hypothetical protein
LLIDLHVTLGRNNGSDLQAPSRIRHSAPFLELGHRVVDNIRDISRADEVLAVSRSLDEVTPVDVEMAVSDRRQVDPVATGGIAVVELPVSVEAAKTGRKGVAVVDARRLSVGIAAELKRAGATLIAVESDGVGNAVETDVTLLDEVAREKGFAFAFGAGDFSLDHVGRGEGEGQRQASQDDAEGCGSHC